MVSSMWPLKVFRLELAKHLRLSDDRLRLWYENDKDQCTELVDMEKTLSESNIAAGAHFTLEVANDAGEFEEKVKTRLDPKSAPTMAAEEPFPKKAAVSSQPSPSPSPSTMSEEQQIQQAMAMSREQQDGQLRSEEMLIMSLATRGKKMLQMRDDGNCLFRALAFRAWGSAERYEEVRSIIVTYIGSHSAKFEAFCPYDFQSYLVQMGLDREYGTNLEIQAFSDCFERTVHIFSDATPEFPPTVIGDGFASTDSPIELAFLRGNHYNAVVSLDDSTTAVADGNNTGAQIECIYCGKRVDDADLHVAIEHADLFG